LNGITSVPNFMKIYQSFQKLLVGDRQTGDLISVLLFLESRLNILKLCLISELGYLSQYSVWLRTGRPGDLGSILGRDRGFFL
jgi:hypothetical protein